MRRGDDTDHIGCVDRGQRRLIERRRQVDQYGVSVVAGKVNRLLDHFDPDERTFFGRERGGKDLQSTLMIGQELGEQIVGDARGAQTREVRDRIARLEVEEHCCIAELEVQVDEQRRRALAVTSSRDIHRERRCTDAALAVNEDDHGPSQQGRWRRDEL